MLVGFVQNDIRKNPTFRAQFHEMCAKVGVDPLASNKGFWAELLGIGDFYYELGECHGHSLKFINPSTSCIRTLYAHFLFSMNKMKASLGLCYSLLLLLLLLFASDLGFVLLYCLLDWFWCICMWSLPRKGVQIVEICLATRPLNGGLINLQELCNLVRQKRKNAREPVSEDDCLRAISKLKVL